MVSTTSFNSDQSKILSPGNGLDYSYQYTKSAVSLTFLEEKILNRLSLSRKIHDPTTYG